MNQFTKEELNNLFKCVRLTQMDYGECADLDNLKFKLLAMINSCYPNQDAKMSSNSDSNIHNALE